MSRFTILAAILVVPLCPESATAQEPVLNDDAAIAGWTGFAPHRAMPHFGHGGKSAGAEHFDLPPHHYSTWYRPKVHELQKSDRCLPSPWRPRGFGNLFAKRQGYRMDYAAFRLADPRTLYGPAYYPTGADETCDCHEGKTWGHCQSCQNCNKGHGCKNCIQMQEVDLNTVHKHAPKNVHHLGTLHR